MQQQIGITGSSTIAADLELEDSVVIVVIGEVNNEGVKLQQSAGRVPYRKVKISDLMVLSGVEATEMRDRVLNANQDADLHVINGNGGESETG